MIAQSINQSRHPWLCAGWAAVAVSRLFVSFQGTKVKRSVGKVVDPSPVGVGRRTDLVPNDLVVGPFQDQQRLKQVTVLGLSVCG